MLKIKNRIKSIKIQFFSKVRLDLALVSRGLFETRARAQRAIKSGLVVVSGRTVLHVARETAEAEEVTVVGGIEFVGRGGDKLKTFLLRHPEVRERHIKGKVCVDLGASTGGFTDCLLSHGGASHVFAIDVGTNQFAKSLAEDKRVTHLEKTDARSLPALNLPIPSGGLGLVTMDLSFISSQLVVGPLAPFLAEKHPEAAILVLVKPNFELGRNRVPTKTGVVKDPEAIKEAIKMVTTHAAGLGLKAAIRMTLPTTHSKNKETFVLLRMRKEGEKEKKEEGV